MVFESFEAHEEHDPSSLATEERRSVPRFAARAVATIYRDSDAMRTGIPGTLHDVSIAGLGVDVNEISVELMEQVKIRLQNDVQRFDREVRGVVRHISPLEDGQYRVGIELMARLTPLEVSLLKIAPIAGECEGRPTWV
jgi:hypothetical protein